MAAPVAKLQVQINITNETRDVSKFKVEGFKEDIELPSGGKFTITLNDILENTTNTINATPNDYKAQKDRPKLEVGMLPTYNTMRFAAVGVYQLVAVYDGSGTSPRTTNVTLSYTAALMNQLNFTSVTFSVDGVVKSPALRPGLALATEAPKAWVSVRFFVPSSSSTGSGSTGSAPSPAASPEQKEVILSLPAYSKNFFKEGRVVQDGALFTLSKPKDGAPTYTIQPDPGDKTAILSVEPRGKHNWQNKKPVTKPSYLNPMSITCLTFMLVFYVLFMVFLALYLVERDT